MDIQEYVDKYNVVEILGKIGLAIAILVITWIVAKVVASLFAKLVNKVPALQKAGADGQSLGKSAVGLRLIHAQTGQPIGAGMCFVRELVSGAVNQVVYLSYLWMLWDDNRQTLADKVMTSTVIVVPKS